MIRTVTVTNNHDESLLMDLRNPYESGFAITEITGISPAEANINTTELSLVDGSVFNSARIPNRNIVLNIKLLPKTTIAEARHRLYKYFPIKRRVRLTFDTDSRSAYIDGYVERNEVNIFDSFEKAQISLICPDPFFKSTEDIAVNMSSFVGRFTFPFSNPVGESTLIMSELTIDRDTEIFYEGDDSAGVVFEVRIFDDPSHIAFHNYTTGQSMTVNDDKILLVTGNRLTAGDILRISTIPGKKSATLTRDTTVYNVLAALGLTPDWITITPGDNSFRIAPSITSARLYSSLNYDVLYEGI